MDGVASAARAKFLDGKFLSLALFVLGGDIVAPFATIALQPNKISHFSSPQFTGKRALCSVYILASKPTTGIGPMTSSLPRKCSAD
jgi:hypothetical protein